MDEFTYTNIFDTKGVEYLIIIGFLLLIIPFWIFINKPLMLKAKIRETFNALSENILKIPQGIFYSKNHTWAHLERSGLAKIGMDDLLLHLTGKIEIAELKISGEKITKGDIIAEISQNEKRLKIASPISGEIQSVNTLLRENSEVLNEDPYGKGWVYLIKPDQWVEETKSCFLAEDANEWVKKELRRFKDFVAMSVEKYSPESAMLIMQEGGELSDNPLSEMPKEVWNDFQEQFLDHDA